MEQVVMFGMVCVMAMALLVCEMVRVFLVVLKACVCRSRGEIVQKRKRMTVMVDGSCTVCNALRTFSVFRMEHAETIEFITAQEVIKQVRETPEVPVAKTLRMLYPSNEAVAENLLIRLHAIAEDGSVLVGADVVLSILDECHAPYPFVVGVARKALPASLVSMLYDTFAKNRHSWFGRGGGPSWLVGSRGRKVVDEAARLRLAFFEAMAFATFLLACLTVAVLPMGNGHKDGATQYATRLVCVALMFLALNVFRKQQQQEGSDNAARNFYDRFVGPATDQSLAIMRMTCAVILFTFTTPFMTAPLAETALVPRFMCKPTGILRLLGRACPGLFGRDELLGSPTRLHALQFATRLLLGFVFAGAATPIATPLAAASWLVYGGVLRSYNSWRGHSFIAAFWTLVVLAWRGGGGAAWSVDALLFSKKKKEKNPGRAAYRGWTRFMATLVFANNYFMAGLSKFCASGVAWAFGINLKAKLMQTSLTQGSFGVYLSLGLRHLPLPFWLFLGVCGLYGEIMMGLVPFKSVAKLCFPAVMWGMHFGIIFLQHIVFVDLLTMIPAWYLWHAVDQLVEPRDYSGTPWDWRRVLAEVRGQPVHVATPLATEDDEKKDAQQEEEQRVVDHVARSSGTRSIFLVACFVAVWAQGAEWYPWNAFRMFADWTPNPVSYERYVALDSTKQHLRNFHMHEINPVLNRKRFVDALQLCADQPDSPDCRDFASFVDPIAKSLPGRPAFLVVEERHWDFVNGIDKTEFCDEMTTFEYDVTHATVTKNFHQPCDPIDWHLCCTRTIGTI